LVQGSSLETTITKIHPYANEFTSTNKMIIENLFQNHTARRYFQKLDLPCGYLIPLVSTQSNSSSLIFTGLGFGLISFTIVGGFLVLF
jgi:hypothetical protein